MNLFEVGVGGEQVSSAAEVRGSQSQSLRFVLLGLCGQVQQAAQLRLGQVGLHQVLPGGHDFGEPGQQGLWGELRNHRLLDALLPLDSVEVGAEGARTGKGQGFIAVEVVHSGLPPGVSPS